MGFLGGVNVATLHVRGHCYLRPYQCVCLNGGQFCLRSCPCVRTINVVSVEVHVIGGSMLPLFMYRCMC